MPTIVKAKKDEPSISVIRRFQRQVSKDRVLQDARKKDYHIKPSQIRKEKKKEWERQNRRARRLALN